MPQFELNLLRPNNIATISRMRSIIELDPPYQRQGAVWSRSKQALLIDSLINNFDIPKIYFHQHSPSIEKDGRQIRYSIIDGRQRIESIWNFMDDAFPLSSDFVFFQSGSTSAAGKTYSELLAEGNEVITWLTSAQLDIVCITTDDIEMIEEMFSRLNEAVPLSAAEKRNGSGGPLRGVVNSIVSTPFFSEKIPFKNSRYRHLDLATKLLLFTHKGGPTSTKKRDLDDFWADYKDTPQKVKYSAESLENHTMATIAAMDSVFIERDPLLSNAGMVSVYFLAFMKILEMDARLPTRDKLVEFNSVRKIREFEDENSISPSDYKMLEFDRLAQSSNDIGALRTRRDILLEFLGVASDISISS